MPYVTYVERRAEERIKREAVLRFLQQGLSIEQIAQGLDLTFEQVQEIIQQHSQPEKTAG